MRTYQYPSDFTSADEEGGFVITFPDLPEAVTQGETIKESIEEATDALEEAIMARIKDRLAIPLASAALPGQFMIPVPAQTAFKAALYEEISRGQIRVETTANLGIDEIEDVLERAGKRIVVTVEDTDELAVNA